jgi:NTE family protein
MERRHPWTSWPASTGIPDQLSYFATLAGGIPEFFRPNPAAWFGAYVPLGVDGAGFYSTAPLRETLAGLIDFQRINHDGPRLTVGATNVRTSIMRYFDNRETPICLDHILASGALPPAFPAVRIDGEHYWDGGILSNTPTEVIFER